METLSKTPAGEAHHNKEWWPALPTGLMCVSPSLSSYKDYPAHQPFIKTPPLHRPPPCMRQAPPPTSPAKSFPESHSAEIISALRNLQEKIRRLEVEKRGADLGLRAEQPSTRPLVTSTQRPVDLGLQAEQHSTRPLVTSTQRPVDPGLQALGRDAPATNVSSTRREAEPRSEVSSTRREAEPRSEVTSTRREAEPRSEVTSTRREAEPRSEVTSTRREAEPRSEVTSTRREAEPRSEVTSTRRQAEPRSEVTSTRRQAEPRSEVTSTRRQAEPRSEVTSTRRQAEPRSEVTSTRRQAEPRSEVSCTRRQAEPRSEFTSTRRQAEQPSDVTSTRREMRSEGASDRPQCNQVLLTQLAAAEARCQQLERQLELMRRTVRLAQQDRTSLLQQQVSMATDPSGDPASGPEHAHWEKLERLEREYIRMTLAQNQAEKKIRELEEKLEEEERQRKLVQEKADLLQTGLEANRLLLQAVSPRPRRRSRGRVPPARRRSREPQSPQQQKASSNQPHHSLRPGVVPFVAGMAVGCSHSVRANVQAVLSLLKHHPRSHPPSAERPPAPRAACSSPSPSSSEPPSEVELKEILSSLQEELRLMGLEQAALVRRVQAGGAERGDVLRDQERLLLRMERKGEHIAQLHRHTQQIKKLRRVGSGKAEQNGRRGAAGTAVATRGRSFGACERINANLKLLKDMRALQKSLRT
ncbi:centrosomal protein of 57 kDa [Gadus morhua]|uniref:Centrosomal protein of 57 kDa-like n=1 Tax=Gadus morhua TaxID=8049 RepID=A0A8C5BW71_GADMO|nr:centrosomal protein of 57 kDa-like [Gadus morhua]